MIFNIKLDSGFTWKVRFVEDRHKVDTLPSMTYAFVVSRDSVQIVLMLEALNSLDVKCDDVQNSYLNANPKDKLWLRYGK